MAKWNEAEYQAKEIVRNKIEKTPAFKQAVKKTMGEIKKMGGSIKVTSGKKR